MGYSGPYSLGARCISEAIGTGIMIFLGEGTLANELLSKTKGYSMGFGWVAFGFANAFFAALICFSNISAQLNPAMCLALWFLGELSAADCFALSAAELGGSMVGAVAVWIFYNPHFKTVPEPMSSNPEDPLLRSRDVVSTSGLCIASYDTRPHASSNKGFQDTLRDIRYYFAQPNTVHEGYHTSLIEQALGREASVQGNPGGLRRHSVQICDLHSRLKKAELEQADMTWLPPKAHNAELPASFDVTSSPHRQAASEEKAWHDQVPVCHTDGKQERLDELYRAAVRADQNAKLSVFATRPGIRSPFFNWVVEMMATAALILGVLLINARGKDLTGQLLIIWGLLEDFFIAQFISVLLLGLGGPTGIAMNPARDFGPRVMHAVLPISGKGSSEWGYAWIPVTACLVGGLAGGALFKGIDKLS